MIEELLKNYTSNKATIEFKQIDIEWLKKMLEYNETINSETDNEAIRGMALSAVKLYDTPVFAGIIGSKTESVALNYQKEKTHKNQFDTLGLKLKIIEIERNLEPIRKDVERVEALIKYLGDKEKFIITRFYFRGYTWQEIVGLYTTEFGFRDADTLQRMRKDAISKMEQVAKKVKSICG